MYRMSMQRAVRIVEQGDIGVLQVCDDVQIPEPEEGEVLIKNEWAGVNFIDTYQRSGDYQIKMPATLGNEVAGRAIKFGPGVSAQDAGFEVGDRVVAYTNLGGFAQYSANAVRRTTKVPDNISTKDAATALLQGLTAITLTTESHRVESGQWVLVHAAAGGLGSLLCQICSYRGAHVIGTVSSEDKARIAKDNGAQHTIDYKRFSFEEVAKQVVALSEGQGVHVVFDGVGQGKRYTFDMNFEILRRKGSLVSCGNASGLVPPVSPLRLGAKNLRLMRPVLGAYVVLKDEFQRYCDELFDLLEKGILRVSASREYPLTTDGIQQAQKNLVSRVTTGKLMVRIM